MYREYLNYGDGDEAVPVILPTDNEFRVAKKFGNKFHFGTAKKNSDPGEYKYDVRYDDSDFETMTKSEVDRAREHFAELIAKDPRAQSGYGTDSYTLLPGKVTVSAITDHKVVLSSYNN